MPFLVFLGGSGLIILMLLLVSFDVQRLGSTNVQRNQKVSDIRIIAAILTPSHVNFINDVRLINSLGMVRQINVMLKNFRPRYCSGA